MITSLRGVPVFLLLSSFDCTSALAQPSTAHDSGPTRVSCPCTADTTIWTHREGRRVNAGKEMFLHVRGTEAFAVLKFDLAALRGLTVTRATLRMNRGQDNLIRVGVSTIATAAWGEGVGGTVWPADQLGPEHASGGHEGCKHPDESEGGASFDDATYSRQPRLARPWGSPGSDLTDVVFGNGGSRWTTVVVQYDPSKQTYELDIPPEFVQAMLLGLQPGGLCLADDFHRGEPDPTLFSRESRGPPELIVETRKADARPAAEASGLRVERDKFGFEWAVFRAPAALGFEVYLCPKPIATKSDLDAATQLPVWLMPTPGVGELRTMITGVRAAEHGFVAVRCIDAAGDWSRPANLALPAVQEKLPQFEAPTLPRFELPRDFSRPFTADESTPISLNGKYIHVQPRTWWNPLAGPVALEAGRNEFVAFQIVLAGASGEYALHFDPWRSPGDAAPAPRVAPFREHPVEARMAKGKYAPEIAVPLSDGERMRLELRPPASSSQPTSSPATAALPAAGPPSPDQATSRPTGDEAGRVVWADVYVPRGAATGVWRTRVVVVRGGLPVLDQPVELNVVEATLPDDLNFQISLTSIVPPALAAGVEPDSPEGWDLFFQLHRLTHEHRATLGVIPIAIDGKPYPGFAPGASGSGDRLTLDWSDWDRRFGGLLDGSAFRDLPREARPLRFFHPTICETWPVETKFTSAAAKDALADKYHIRDTWADPKRGKVPPRPDQYMVWPIERAVSDDALVTQRAALRAWSEHFAANRWSTRLHVYLNNPHAPRKAMGWWSFNDPLVPDDFRAVAYWLGLYRAAMPRTGGPGGYDVRIDVARPQFSRSLFEGRADLTVVGGELFEKNDLLTMHRDRFGEVWNDNGDISPEFGWASVYKWGWAARLAGATGLSIPSALGDARAWSTADTNAILLVQPVAASLRLKALRRVQQDMEWLDLRIRRSAAEGIPEGYELATVGRELITRSGAKFPMRTTLLPLIKFERDLDTVALEEIRRGLRRPMPTTQPARP